MACGTMIAPSILPIAPLVAFFQRLDEKLTNTRLLWLLFGLAVLLFAPSLRNAFVGLDDGLLIYKNAAVGQLSPASILHIFTSYDPELYVPLTLLSYQVEHALFGFTPFWYHLTNILLHGGSTVLVFLVAERLMTGNRWAAFACAALFAMHPLNVEAVAWASARKDLLSAFFLLASLCAYLSPARRGFDGRYAASFAFFLLGLLSKVSVATLPLVLLLANWKNKRPWKESLREAVPFFALSAVFLVIAVFGKAQNLATLTLWQQALLLAKSAAFTLEKLMAPVGLSVMYEQLTPIRLLSAEFLIPLGVVLALIAGVVVSLRRNRLWAFALLFFGVTFLPTVATFAKNHMIFYASDRYAYLPSIGIFLLLGLLADRCMRHRFRPMAAVPACVAVVLAVLTLSQQQVWLSSETLYAQAIRVTPASSIAYTNLGAVLIDKERIDEAVTALEKAVQLDPDNPAASSKLGALYHQKGHDDRALPLLLAGAAASDKRPVLSMEDLGPYYLLAEFLGDQGKTAEELEVFLHAVKRAPLLPEPHFNLALKYEKYGRLPDAAAEYTTAIELYPGYLDALYRLAGILSGEGRLPEAAALLQRIVDLNPGYEKALPHLQQIEALIRVGGR